MLLRESTDNMHTVFLIDTQQKDQQGVGLSKILFREMVGVQWNLR